MADKTRLFPEFMGPGAEGREVAAYQMVLKAMGMDFGAPIAIAGIFDEETVTAIQHLQGWLRISQSGNFDRRTREELARATKLDIDTVPRSAMDRETIEAQPNPNAEMLQTQKRTTSQPASRIPVAAVTAP